VVHHVELLPDAAAEAAVRGEWERLAEAGLPSLTLHRHPSNRPHVTLTVVGDLDGQAVTEPLRRLPLSVELGPLVCFGSGPWVLVRLVVPTSALLALQADLVGRLGPPASRWCEVDRWVPHVSLAHGLDADQLGAAVALLSPTPAISTVLDRARHWDSAARTEHELPAAVSR
jgi:hypothetical protein